MSTNLAVSKMNAIKSVLSAESVAKRISDTMGEGAGLFTASLLDVAGSDNRLMECDPNDLVREALKAATLKLPINRGLGFAWLVPRKNKGKMTPIFQIGYKGYLQLAQRTGAYRYINAGPVYEGELVRRDKLSGEVDLNGEKKSSSIIGYFAYIETLNGFRKTSFATVDEITEHAKKYSDSFGKDFSAWTTAFDAMAIKTLLAGLLGKYGVMSIEMITAFTSDDNDRVLLPHQSGTSEAQPQLVDLITSDDQQSQEVEVDCPNREDGERMFKSFCDTKCQSRVGCPAFPADQKVVAGAAAKEAKKPAFQAGF